MKRGLITWNRNEISPDDFREREYAVQVLLKSKQLDALAVYSDLWRSNQARHLTNFMPYFNRALLVIAAEGPSALLCGLSPRVYPWIRSVTTIEDVRPAGNFAAPLVQLAAERRWNRVGILDAEEIPHDIFMALRSGTVDFVSVPGHMVYRPADDPTEISIRRVAAALCRSVLAEELRDAAGRTGFELAGRLERRLRLAGAEDLVLLMTNGDGSPAPARGIRLEDRCSVSVALEYRGHWIRLTRPNCSDEIMRLCVAAWKNGPTFVEDLAGPYPYTCGVRGTIVSAQTEIQVAEKRLFYGDTCLARGSILEPL